MSKTVNVCRDCLGMGAEVNQAFSPSEISFLISAAVGTLRQMSDNPIPAGQLQHIAEMRNDGLGSLRKLLISMPEKMRGEMLEFFNKAGMEIVFEGCQLNVGGFVH